MARSLVKQIESNLELGVPGQKKQFDNSYLRYCNPEVFDDPEGCPEQLLEFEDLVVVYVNPHNFAKMERASWSGAWQGVDEQAVLPTADIIQLDDYVVDCVRNNFFDEMYKVSAQEYEQSLNTDESPNFQYTQTSLPRSSMRKSVKQYFASRRS